ncbi:hypothetical protein CQA57_04505 [Helicobacter anseris]|uniref:ABC transporter domain-containing protein n=1 Tax=Helicobacter anseris TaxID=375926 RepID=A0A3D8J9L3_9HELI|nr:ABC transporter ATP-binding protein [Helicobacter anseris]RDU73571.1 hypothetical protein CQA57_04505 [Helicobacter anseris]
MNSLKICNLSVKRSGNEILKDISLELYPSELTAMLALNGSGKSTLMESVIGGLDIFKGEIFFNTINIQTLSSLERSKIIAFVPQKFECAFDYNVLDFISFGANNEFKWYENPNKQVLQHARDILKDLGILDFEKYSLQSLSGGQKQMVLLARALLQKSKVLLLDEPTAWLDLKNQRIFFDILIKKIKEYKLCALINIHDPNIVCKYADRVYMIKDGKNLYSGDVQTVMTQEKLSTLYDIPIKVEKLNSQIFIFS